MGRAFVYNYLKPGGIFYIVEFHPFMDVFVQSVSGDMRPKYGYFYGETFEQGGGPSYAGSQPIQTPTYAWEHSLGETVTALIEVGLGHRIPTRVSLLLLPDPSDDGAGR